MLRKPTATAKLADQLAAHNLTYWSPGPAAGTAWALTATGAPAVVRSRVWTEEEIADPDVRTDPTRLTSQQRHDAARRAIDLMHAMRTPGHEVTYGFGGSRREALTYPTVMTVVEWTGNRRDRTARQVEVTVHATMRVPFDPSVPCHKSAVMVGGAYVPVEAEQVAA